LFFADKNTIGVFDISKVSIVFFDMELNFIKEQKVDSDITDIFKDNGYIYAFGNFGDKSCSFG
jgi:hypothetical protein